MANYFKFFPKTYYIQSNTSTSLDVLTNITSRFKFEDSFKNNNSVFYEYEIKDGDTPEIIADKFYGSPENHWIVLNFNDIVDPQFDWPLDQRTLIRFIDEKYTANADTANNQTGVQWAKLNVKQYNKVETITNSLNNESKIVKITVDNETHANLSSSTTTISLQDGNVVTIDTIKETISYYDYEIAENESKRNIKLLKPEFVSTSLDELRKVLS